MSNLIFPAEQTRTVEGVGTAGTPFTSEAGLTAVIYNDAAGVNLAGIAAYPSGTSIPSAQLTLDAYGRLPFFYSPDTSTTLLYVKVGTGPVTPIFARCLGSEDPNTKLVHQAVVGALNAAYVASSAGATGNAAAPHAQLGPTAYTLNSGAVGTMHSVLALRGNDPSGDGTLRLYITPNMAGSTGIAGYTYGETAGIKIFGDPYFDGAGYRDFGIVYAPAWKENTPYDTGSWGTGAYWLNSKIGPDAGTAGALWSNNPDIGFSFQDGTFIAGRFSYVKNLAQNASWPGFIVGAGKQDIIRRTSAIVMEVQGDIGFNSTSRSIRWYQPDATTADNTVTFNSNDVTFTFSSVRRWQVKGNGSLIMGDGSTALGTTAQSGYFYMRSMAGTPTGAPGDGVSGATPLVMDTTAGKLWANLGGTWKSVTFA